MVWCLIKCGYNLYPLLPCSQNYVIWNLTDKCVSCCNHAGNCYENIKLCLWYICERVKMQPECLSLGLCSSLFSWASKNVDSLCTGSTVNWGCGLRGSRHWGIASVRDFPRCTTIWILQAPEQTFCTQPATVSLKFYEHKQSEFTSKTCLSLNMLQTTKFWRWDV